MTDENLNTFAELVDLCKRGCYKRVNVASKKRSAAIIAAWEELFQLRLEVSRLKLQLQLLQNENKQLQDTITAAEEREMLLQAYATSRGGRVPQ